MIEIDEAKRASIILRVHQDTHTEIKVAAAMRNISMSLLIHRAIAQYLRKELKNNILLIDSM